MTIDNLLSWIDSEITKAQQDRDKSPKEGNDYLSRFARVRLLKFAKGVVMEFVKKFSQ